MVKALAFGFVLLVGGALPALAEPIADAVPGARAEPPPDEPPPPPPPPPPDPV